jgi:Repeat of unknown function (DUF5648)
MKHLIQRHIFHAFLFVFFLTSCGGTDDVTTSAAKTSSIQHSGLLASLAIAFPNGQLPAGKAAQAARELAQNPAVLKLTAETSKTKAASVIHAQAGTSDYKPVTRIQNTTLTGAYFFTIYDTERAAALANNPNWKQEGSAFWASLSPDVALNPVHRFRNVLNGSYLYTIYDTEKADIIANYSSAFMYEGVAWHAKQTIGTGWSPLYRFRNLLNGTYLFSAFETEKDAIVANYSAVFKLEGIAYYVRQDAPASEIINGIVVPLEPDPVANNATLAGVDNNENGVRDDVERKIASLSTIENPYSLLFLHAQNYNKTLTIAMPTEDAAKLYVGSNNCSNISPELDKKILYETIDSKERAKKFNAISQLAGVSIVDFIEGCEN